MAYTGARGFKMPAYLIVKGCIKVKLLGALNYNLVLIFERWILSNAISQLKALSMPSEFLVQKGLGTFIYI